ncbi:ABC transporter ATP-binding protein [Motiliproteus sp. MSK22-1]|uniref:ABC transporter ATP-binding protein n=1 Tax=Motiliproteus sp. MSK22-1 TaxID=1897630 RepID=UPI00097817F3|nr:ABC transporter ATP-binding protein [Motiliproteus sp. MSK22-1]OMH30266.1 ABC transporter ATP-binding protein [Motiliproteus sp. MSK22-1]
MIEIDNIHVTFAQGTPVENHAMRGLSLFIPEGDFVTVIGSNGAGKSTLLNAISGEIRVDTGSIKVGNQDVTRRNTERRAGDVARVFQDPMAGTCEGLSIEENLALAIKRGDSRGLGMAVKREYRQRFKTRLKRLGLGLENRLEDRMGLLSGGQRQAVSLLMATLQPMQILLLDEHTAALDPKTAAFVLELTREIIEEQQLTALMVTHSMKQALEVGSRTLMLHEGKIAFDVEGEQRKGLEVKDLLALFEKNKGEELADDSLLLG